MTDTAVQPKHPATFTRSILHALDEMVPPGRYLDPFAGTGKVQQLQRLGNGALEDPGRRLFHGIEIEKEWADMDSRTHHGDALVVMRDWIAEDIRFDGVVTSPVYGNRMSDHHNAKDASRRRSYKFDLGRDLTEGNSGSMYFWQEEYKALHVKAWQLAFDITRDEGHMFLNVKNFYRTIKKVQVPQMVVAWHMKTLASIGWRIDKVHQVGTPGLRDGENRERFETEAIIHAVKPGTEG